MPLTRKNPIGTVHAFAGAAAPSGYLICDGSAVSRTAYSSLFSVIGTLYGQGDGTTTFNLPDYRGKFLRGSIELSSVTGTGSAITNQATFTNHGFNRTGFKVTLTSGALAGLVVGREYYAIIVDENTLAFATSIANAIANTRIAISGVNSAVITQAEDPDSDERVPMNVGGTSSGVGSVQEFSTQEHRHQFVMGYSYDRAGSSTIISTSNTSNGTVTYSPYSGTSAMSTVPFVSGGTVNISKETRPNNVSINYIISY